MQGEGTHHRKPNPLPAGTGSRASLPAGLRGPALWLGAALILVVALFLRGQDLDGGKMSPDDGEFLHSARVHELTDGIEPAKWIRQDLDWAAMLAEDAGRIKERASFPHGYLHQLCIRYAARAGHVIGFGNVAALRLDQAIFGALTALLVMLMLRRIAPEEPLVALAGGALMATQLGHVALSRSGWGQAACTFFLIWMIMIAWRMHRTAGEQDTGKLWRGTLGIMGTSLLAYGFHEMATVYVLMFAVIVFLQFGGAPNGTSQWPWKSRRVAFGLLACVPVGALTVYLLLFNEYAQQTWFTSPYGTQYTWTEIRRLSIIVLFGNADILRQIGWPILILAPIGLAGAFTRDMRWLIWLVLWTLLPAAFLFLRFENPSLVRIYLPSFVMLVVLAAEGLGVLWALARHRAAGAVADAAAIAAIGWCAMITYTSYFGERQSPHFVSGVHGALPEEVAPRGTFRPIADALAGLAPTEPVGVAYVWGPAYRVLDLKLPTIIISLDDALARKTHPAALIAPRRMMEGPNQARMVQFGGPYKLAASDTYNDLGLYVIGGEDK